MSNMPLTQLDSARPPWSFAGFKFRTIGQEPQLLKRISIPAQNSSYEGASSRATTKCDHPHSLSFLGPHLSADTCVNPSSSVDAVMSDEDSNIVINTIPTQQPNSPEYQLLVDDKGSTKPSGYTRSSKVSISPTISHMQAEKSPLSGSSAQNHVESLENLVGEKMHVFHSSISGTSGPSQQDSPYLALRDLHARLLLSLSNLHPPNISNALVLAQSANSHATNALSAAQSAYTLAQQSLLSAQDAVISSRECLRAAEQSKADASEAVTAVDRLGSGNRGSGSGPSEEGQWRSVIIHLQDDLRALGDWVRERESEELSRKQDSSRSASARRYHSLVEAAVSSMTRTRGNSFYETQTEEATPSVRNDRKADLPSQTQTPLSSSSGQVTQRLTELEADTITGASTLQHDHHLKPAAGLPDVVPTNLDLSSSISHLVSENTHPRKPTEGKAPTQNVHEIAHPQPVRSQGQNDDEENRLRELHRTKLEIARFQMSERQRIGEKAGSQPSMDALSTGGKSPVNDVTASTNRAPETFNENVAIKKPSENVQGKNRRFSTLNDQIEVEEMRGKNEKPAQQGNQAQIQEHILEQERRPQTVAQNERVSAADSPRANDHVSQSPQTESHPQSIDLQIEQGRPRTGYTTNLTYPSLPQSHSPSTPPENVHQEASYPLSNSGDSANISRHAPGTNVTLADGLNQPHTSAYMNDGADADVPTLKKEPISPMLSRRSKELDAGAKGRVDTEQDTLASRTQNHCLSSHHQPHLLSPAEPRSPYELKTSAVAASAPRSTSLRNALVKSVERTSQSIHLPVISTKPSFGQTEMGESRPPIPHSTEQDPLEILHKSWALHNVTEPQVVTEYTGPSTATPDPQPLQSNVPQGGKDGRSKHDMPPPLPDEGVHGIGIPNSEPILHRRGVPGPASPSTTFVQPPVSQSSIIRGPRAMGLTPRDLYSPPTSPVLGKRRHNDSLNLDEHSPHRQRFSNDRPETTYTPRARHAVVSQWRSPSPGRPALQARIGARDPETYMIGAGQSYRPRYALNQLSREPLASNNYQQAEDSALPKRSSSSSERFTYDHHITGSRDETPSHNYFKGRGINSARGSYRGRGGHTGSQVGSRALNLEQRISTHKPPTLMHRLGSPPHRR